MKSYLFTPGPVPLSQAACDALSQPAIHHRSAQFLALFRELKGNLKKIFQTQSEVFLHASSGTGGLESAIVNTLSPGDTVLVINSGKFGERWAEIARAYQMKVHELMVPWGEAVSVEEVSQCLKRDPLIKAVLCQACETSTGVLHPVAELGSLVREDPKILYMVDGISALGAIPLPMDEFGIDVLVSGSHKGLSSPTGLSLISLSEKAWKFYESARSPRYYFDLGPERTANDSHETRFSSPVALVRSLSVNIEILLSEGLERTFARVSRLSQSTVCVAHMLGLTLFPQSPSPTLTALSIPQEIGADQLKRSLETYGIMVAGGQDQLKGKILRIGHMGSISTEDQLYMIEKLITSLLKLNPKLSEEVGQLAMKSAREILSS